MPQPKKDHNGIDETSGVLNSAIGTRVRQLRQSRDLTCADVEQLSNGRMWASHLSVLERGGRVWQAHHLEAVANALGVSPRELLPETLDGDTLGTRDTLDDARPNPADLTNAERELVGALRAAGAGGPALVDALTNVARVTVNVRELSAADPLEGPTPAANRDQVPGATRAKLSRLLEPRRMGASEPATPTSRNKRKDPT